MDSDICYEPISACRGGKIEVVHIGRPNQSLCDLQGVGCKAVLLTVMTYHCDEKRRI